MERRSSERRSNNEWSGRVEVTNSPSVELRTRCARANDAHAGPDRPNQARKRPIWKLACKKEVILRSWGVLAFGVLQQGPNFIQIPHSAEITNTHQDSHSKTPLANWTLNDSSRCAVGRGVAKTTYHQGSQVQQSSKSLNNKRHVLISTAWRQIQALQCHHLGHLVALYHAMRLRFGYGFEWCDANGPRNVKNTNLAKHRPVLVSHFSLLVVRNQS